MFVNYGGIMSNLENLSFEEHMRLAEIAEEQMDTKNMITHLNIALGMAEDKKPILEKLLAYYLNDFNPNRPLKILNELLKLDPENPVYYKHTIGILMEINKVDLAVKLAEKARKFSDDAFFKNIFTDENKNILVEKKFSDLTITLLFGLFSGREGVYARQWKNSDGQTGYLPVKEPLSEKVIKNHLNGNYTIGIYQQRLDSTVNWLCIDIDIAKHILNQVLSDDEKFKEADYRCQKFARGIYDELSKFSIDVLIENSGFKGRHVWVLFSKPIPARIAKKFGETLKLNIKDVSPEINIEVFPKQNFVKSDGLGNLVKLPLGIHLANGKRSFFTDKNGKETEDVDKLLKSVVRVDENKILEYLNYYRVSEIYEKYSPETKLKPAEKISFPVAGTSYILEKDKEFQYLIYKCPVIKEIYSNAVKKNELSYDEMIVISHSIGHLDTGVDAVNAIFSKCYNITPDKFLKSTLKGNPISCAKIRSKLPGITSSSNCNCHFPKMDGLYPSPVLHIRSLDVNARVPSGFEISSLNFHNILDNYIALKKQMHEVGLLLREYEEKFETLFKTSGVDFVDTAIGKFRRVCDENGTITYKIDI